MRSTRREGQGTERVARRSSIYNANTLPARDSREMPLQKRRWPRARRYHSQSFARLEFRTEGANAAYFPVK